MPLTSINIVFVYSFYLFDHIIEKNIVEYFKELEM